MSFRNEVRIFMQRMNEAFVEQKIMITAQKKYIDSLLKQNTELFNRLMAKDFTELQTYSPVSVQLSPFGAPTYDFEQDEDLAGTVVDPDSYLPKATE